MSSKGCECVVLEFTRRTWRKPRKPSVTVLCLWVEIRTEHIWNTSHTGYWGNKRFQLLYTIIYPCELNCFILMCVHYRFTTKQAIYRYVQYNTETPSYNNFYSWEAISITHSECVFVALVFQHAMSICYTVICGLSGSTSFFHVIS